MADASALPGVRWQSRPSFVLATVTVCLFTDLFLYTMVVPVIPFLLRDRLNTPTQDVQSRTSALLSAYSAASVLCSVPSGWMADRLGLRKPLLYIGLVALASGSTMFGFGQTYRVLFAARLLQGVNAAIMWSIGLAMIQDTVGPRRVGQAIGTVFSFTAIGELTAPALGGALYQAAGMRALFGLSAGLISINLIMLLVLVETKSHAAANATSYLEGTVTTIPTGPQDTEDHEGRPLLVKGDSLQHHRDGYSHQVLQVFPVLRCFGQTRFLMAMLLSTVQGLIIGLFDATVPTEAAALFHFSSLKTGFLFTALILPYIGLSPLAGMAVDKYGTKLLTAIGYGYFTACLAILGLPSQHLLSGVANQALFGVILAFNGCGLAVIGPLSFVEGIDVAAKYELSHPGLLGENGPYAQVLGFNTVFMFAGMTAGPLLGGVLRESFGFGEAGLVFAGIAAVTVVMSYFFVGETAPSPDLE